MNALQTQTQPGGLQLVNPPKLATAIAAAMFSPAILAALPREGRPAFNGGALAMTLAEAQARPVSEKELAAAARAEVTLRHGGRVDSLVCMGAAWPLVAVGFTATVIPAQLQRPARVDPVDLLVIGRLTSDQETGIQTLCAAVSAMLQAMAGRNRGQMADVINRFQRVHSAWAAQFTGPARRLYDHACAANIELLVNAAYEGA